MKSYVIKAYDDEGNKIRRIISVENEADLLPYLQHFNVNVISMKKQSFIMGLLNRKKKIKKSEVIEILENLYLVVKSGMPANIGISDLAEDAENPAVKDLLEDLSYRIQMGMTFSKAFEKYEGVFGEVVVNLIKIGEETGQLENTLRDAMEHIQRLEDLKSKTKQAMIYPSIAFTVLIGALVFWLVFVLPKMSAIFESFDMELPPITLFIMAVSEFTQNYILLIIAGVVAAVFLHITARKKVYSYRRLTDRLLLKMPIFGQVVANYNFAFFSEYIRLMISAGLPLYQSLQVMQDSIGNTVYKEATMKSRDAISTGKSFSGSLSEQGIFPALIIRMIGIGESTGHLDDQLESVSQYYYKKVDYVSQNIAKLIEPLMLLVLGAIIVVIMLALIVPIMDLVGGIGR